MYTVQHTIFGKYVDVNWAETYEEAKRHADNYREYGGWLNVRIITPQGETIQVHGE